MGKWIALALIVAGISLLVIAYRMDNTSSFNDGTFMTEMATGILGGILFIVGAAWLLISAFFHL